MSRGLRILHIADSHIGSGVPDRPRNRGRRRGDDIIDSYRRVLDRAREFDVDLVVHGGDVFDRPDPAPSLIAVAAEPLLSLAADGIPVAIVPGNHERSVLPNSLLLSHENVHILAEPRTLVLHLRGRRVAITGLPCIRRMSAERFPAALAATGWAAATADVRLLLLHQTIESATCGPVGYRFRSGDDVIERDAIPSEFDYVALGHIHRMQRLEATLLSGPPLVYAGSPDRISFAERDEPKGCILIEEQGGELVPHFFEHDVRPMSVTPIDLSGLNRLQVEEAIFGAVAALPQRALARMRLTGQTTRAVVRGLRLSRRCAEMRPDASVAVSMEAVEFVPERAHRPARGSRSSDPFAAFEATAGPHADFDIADLAKLPNVVGTYALHEANGRLLYVGKAKQLRTRVRTHLRGKGAAEHFSGWTRNIARVAVRPAGGELEALLIEADLIRTQRPPFNRQMRSWSRYCYLCECDLPYAQLSICTEPIEGARCFGPLRSRMAANDAVEALATCFGLALCPERGARTNGLFGEGGASELCERYFDGRCCGVCGGKATNRDYAARVAARDALLTGVDDAPVVAWEQQFEAAQARDPDDPQTRALGRFAATLRGTFEHAATLRAAEALDGGLLLMPCDDAARTVVGLCGESLDVLRCTPEEASARRLLERRNAARRDRNNSRNGRIAKATVDVLATVARHLRRLPEDAVAISAERAAGMTADELIELLRAGATAQSLLAS